MGYPPSIIREGVQTNKNYVTWKEFKTLISHMGQNSKQINIAKYVSKFLIYDAKMLDTCVKSQKKKIVHCPFLQSQAE